MSEAKLPADNVVTYIRCSTGKQNESTASMENQSADLRNYCHRHNFRILEEFRDEGCTGDGKSNTGLLKAMRYCRQNKRKVHRFVMHDLSRLSRDKESLFSILDEFQSMDIDVEVIRSQHDDF